MGSCSHLLVSVGVVWGMERLETEGTEEVDVPEHPYRVLGGKEWFSRAFGDRWMCCGWRRGAT